MARLTSEQREIISKLYQACRYNRVELLNKTLVRKLEALSDNERCAIGNRGVRVRMNDIHVSRTCLLIASLTADLDVIKFILRYVSSDITRRDSRHETILHKACKSNVKTFKRRGIWYRSTQN